MAKKKPEPEITGLENDIEITADSEEIIQPDAALEVIEAGKNVTLEGLDPVTLFTENKLEPYLSGVEVFVKSLVTDVTTPKGRNEIKSNAYNVARIKTGIDAARKSIVSEWKEKAKAVDMVGKMAWDRLEALQAEVKRPLTEWEADEAAKAEAIEREKREAEEAARLAETAERERKDKEAAEEKAKLEAELAAMKEKERVRLELEAEEQRKKEQVAREQKAIEEAAEKARKDAEERAEREKQEAAEKHAREIAEAKQREADAKLAAEKAVQAQIEAEAKATKDREDAVLAERQRAQEEAVQRERERLEKERVDREAAEWEAKRQADEAEKKAANVAHRKQINNEAVQCFVDQNVLNPDQAKAVVKLIMDGKVAHVTITY